MEAVTAIVAWVLMPLEVVAEQVGSVTVGNVLQENGTVMVMLVAGFVLVAVALVSRRGQKVPPGCRLPPVYSSSIPLVGNFIGFARDPLGFVRAGRKACGSVFTIDMIAEKCTFMIGAEAHIPFFEASDEELDQAAVYSFMTPIFGKGVVYDTPLYKRRQQMRALGRSLRPSVLKSYPPKIAEETKAYLDKHWGDSGTADLKHTFAALVINTASATLLGPELRGEMFDEMSELYEMLDQGLTPLSVFFPHAPTTAHKTRDSARVEISKLFGKVVEKRRNDPDASTKYTDIVQMLMEFEYKDGTKFTDDEICGMIIACLFAGQHTSSIVSTWSLLYLLEDKRKGGKWHDKVMEELSSLQPHDGAFAAAEGLDSSVIQQEETLYKVVKEAIRLEPPLIMLMRRVLKPITMPDGTYIPAGHRAIVSNAIAQRLDEIFENPNEFDPSRWESFNIAKLPKYSFIGFGAGIHTCMGESFAFMQVRTILSVILSTYDIEMVSPFPEPNFEAMVVPPKGPNLVSFKRKTKPLASTKSSDKAPETNKTKASGDASLNEDTTTVYTKEEVAKHNTKDSAWLIVKGKVYDVTNYLSLHQGGDAAILKYAGKEATAAVSGPQHPGTVWTLLERYEIGQLAA